MWTPKLARRGQLAQEIVKSLESDIESGDLKPGAQLPTHRELAEAVNVAIGTITRAYALAKQQGLVTGTTGRGTFVAGTLVAPIKHAVVDLSQNMVMRDTRDPAIRSLLANFGDPASIAPLLDLDPGPSGSERHLEVGARWIARTGFEPSPDNMVISAGVQHGMHIVLSTLAKPGDLVMTEEVTYAGIRAIASLLHLQLRGLAMDTEGLEPQALEEACRQGGKFLYTTPTLQNPTATTMSDSRRREIARIVQKYGVTVLEDDVYGFLMPDAPLPLLTYAPEHTYFLSSTSKRLAPGLRIAYCVCPHGAQSRLANAVRTTIWEPAPLMAALVTKWIQDGTAQRVTSYKQKEVQARHELATRILGPSLAVSPHRWIRLSDPWRAEDLTNECRARGVLISPASAFATNRDNLPIAVRVCLASSPSRQQLEPALETIANLLRTGPTTHFRVT
jgi:DNA-binding transcriptional MocR family regulator